MALASSITGRGTKISPRPTRYSQPGSSTSPKATRTGVNSTRHTSARLSRAAPFSFLLEKTPILNRECSLRMLKAWTIWVKESTIKAMVWPASRLPP